MTEADRFPEHACYGRAEVVRRWIPAGTATLLDAGCAYGYATRFFAERASRTCAIDPNAQLIDIARRRYPGIAFAVAGTEDMPFEPQTFDVVVMADVLEHVRDERRTLDEVFRILKPGGRFIVTVPNRGAFAFLDLDNIVFAFRRVAPAFYDLLHTRKEGRSRGEKPGYDAWHRHYDPAGLVKLLDASAFGGKYRVIAFHRWGLVLEPLVDVAINVSRLVLGRRGRPLTDVLTALVHFEDRVRAGRFSYNLGMLVTKSS